MIYMQDRWNMGISEHIMSILFLQIQRIFNCRKKQFFAQLQEQLVNSAWKKINAVFVFRLLRTYIFFSFPRRLSYAFRGVQNANTETQFNIYICIYICIQYETGGWVGRKGVEGEGGTIIIAAMRFLILRNASFFLPTVRVLFSTVKEYQFCTSQ